MANDEHVAMLRRDGKAWNAWRRENPDIRPDLSRAGFIEEHFGGVNPSGAILNRAILNDANLSGADLKGAEILYATLTRANLSGANLSGADLEEAHLVIAKLIGANLNGAYLHRAYLDRSDLSGASLIGADLRAAILIDTNFSGADLTGCHVHGVSAWGLKLERTKQQNLVIATKDEPKITVDNIEVAQFIYLMASNQKVRDVIDTITSKAVLILGRFTDERKAVLDALREELRKRG